MAYVNSGFEALRWIVDISFLKVFVQMSGTRDEPNRVELLLKTQRTLNAKSEAYDGEQNDYKLQESTHYKLRKKIVQKINRVNEI